MNKELKLIKEQAELTYQKLSDKERTLFEFDKCVLCDGPINSKVLAIARDLGRDEVEEEVPLIGPAGSLFRFIEMKLGVESFKCNVVPYKPHYNKVFPKQVREKFYPIVHSLIELVKPKAVIIMGNEALELFTGISGGILNFVMEERPIYEAKFNLPLFPIAHPSYIIRQGVTLESLKTNKNDKKVFKELFFHNIYAAWKFVGDVK